MPTTTFCDQCQAEFDLQPMTEKCGEIERAYIKCPECGREYTAYYTNACIREKQAKMKKLQEKYRAARGFRDIKQAQKLFRQMGRIKKQIGGDMDDLREETEASTKGITYVKPTN